MRIPKGTLGEDTSRLLGALTVARVRQACMRRASDLASAPGMNRLAVRGMKRQSLSSPTSVIPLYETCVSHVG